MRMPWEIDQRLRDIDERLGALQKSLALTDDLAATPDANHDRADILRDIERLRQERDQLTAGDVRQQSRDRAVLVLNERLAALERDLADVEARAQRLVASLETGVSALETRLSERLAGVEARVLGLETRLGDWFASDKRDRRTGQIWANAYRVALLALVSIDIVARVLR